MDKFLFLIYCAGNTLIYSILKFSHIELKIYSTMQIISYANVLSFLFVLPYFFKNNKKILSTNSIGYFKLSLTVFASMLKVFAIAYVSPKNAAVISFTLPIIMIVLSFLILGEYSKKNIRYYLATILAFAGVLIFIGYDINHYGFIYFILFLHVILRAFVNIFIKQLSNNKYMTFFFLKFFYALFGFLVIAKSFHPELFLNKYVIIIAILSFIDQLSLIKSYEIANKISLLQTLDYSRIFFTIFWTYLLLSETILLNQFYGLIVIIFAIIFSNFKIKAQG